VGQNLQDSSGRAAQWMAYNNLPRSLFPFTSVNTTVSRASTMLGCATRLSGLQCGSLQLDHPDAYTPAHPERDSPDRLM
jgi:hypothetical protein